MNPHDEEIDKVLGALKTVEPEEGMEARILRRLSQSAERHAASPWRMRVAAALAAGAVFAAVALVVVHRPHAAVPQVEKANNVAVHGANLRAKAQVAAPLREVKPAAAAFAVKPAAVRVERPVAAQTASTAERGAILSESFPAPPLPLTEQEKLLVRIVHRGETRERELPTPLPLGTEVAALRADADKFFEDPTTGENKWKQLVALQAAPN
jgi:hypothetical protein